MFDFLFHNLRNRKKPNSEAENPEDRLPPARSQDIVFNPFGRIADVVKTTVYEMNRGDEAKSEEEIREILSQIAVVAFIGPSGTGKSTRAIKVAKDNNINYLIDDGILIHGSRIVAGSSAKRASTKIESVKQAIFADETRAANMRRALLEELPPTLMILGTSRDMLDRICANLWLSKPSMLIRIEDITTEEERRIAKETRMSEGKHTIPVPSMEIRHEFSGNLAEPFIKLRRKLDRSGREPIPPESERTVVRPTFSTLGSYSMSDEAMAQMVEIILGKVPGVAGLREFRVFKEPYGVSFDIRISLYYGFDAQKALLAAQKAVSETVERLTSINVLTVDVRAVHLERPKKYNHTEEIPVQAVI